MAENSAIEWTDHTALPPRVLGAYKSAATKTGCTVEQWMERRRRGLKWCFRCCAWKPLAEFSVDRSRAAGRTSSCRPCTSDASTASRYGMTLDELRAFRLEHGNRCGICTGDRLLVIDHDHRTGRARGLLCPNCNSAIGKLKESPALLAAAAAYLEKHRG